MTKLAVGDIAPDFTLPTGAGKVRLSEELDKAEKGVVVYFYPKAMTPGCTKEACDFIVSMPMVGHINSLNASVAGSILMYESMRQRLAKRG